MSYSKEYSGKVRIVFEVNVSVVADNEDSAWEKIYEVIEDDLDEYLENNEPESVDIIDMECEGAAYRGEND